MLMEAHVWCSNPIGLLVSSISLSLCHGLDDDEFVVSFAASIIKASLIDATLFCLQKHL